MAAEWWNPDGKFKPLHKFNPIRLDYIKQIVKDNLGFSSIDRPLDGYRLLDIGCGGGLLSEPMANLGAEVVGVDAAEKNISAAKIHAQQSGVEIDYRCTTAENLAAKGEKFDIILNMEVVEHVNNVELFIAKCSEMLQPGGIMFIATLNRTFKSFALAIIGAEYILQWLPKGTHHWEKFITPEEMENIIVANSLSIKGLSGVSYNPFTGKWSMTLDTAVNYIMVITNPN